MRRRLVIPGIDLREEVIDLPPPTVRHVAGVLRLGRGDELLLLDGRGVEALATIDAVSPGRVAVRITSRSTISMSTSPPLHLVQSLPKGSKLDEIIRRATELGVATIRPVLSERTVPRPSSAQLSSRVKRWQKISTEAARQCRRAHLPQLLEVLPLDEALSKISTAMVRIMLWEGESSTGLAEILAAKPLEPGVALVIGPEGGFSDDESRLALDLGFDIASLGSLVLRVETAALAACSVAQLYLGGFAPDPPQKAM